MLFVVVNYNKYTLLNFIPKNLFEQFRRIVNILYIFVIILVNSTRLHLQRVFVSYVCVHVRDKCFSTNELKEH